MKHTYSFSISLLLSFIYLFHASAQPYVIKRLEWKTVCPAIM